MKAVFYILSAALLLNACDKIDEPFENKGNVINTDGLAFDTTYSEFANTKRILVLEEFTGYRCSNCPAGTLIAKQLVQDYPDQLMLLSIHASTDFAAPLNNPDGSFTTDFRTTEGEEYLTAFEVENFPSGMVNRLYKDNKYTVGKDEWEARILDLKDLAPKYSITAMNLYHDSLNYVKTKVDVVRTNGTTENVKVLLLLTESEIIDWQIDGVNTLSNYVHNHVLRGSMNGVWGADLSFSNDSATYSAETTLNSAWNQDHMEVVILVYDAITKEVLQANRVGVN